LFDFISPYAHIGWALATKIAAEHGREIVPVPVLFAALLDANGQKGPAEIPSKRLYTFKDACRKAHAAGLPPLLPPPSHPFNPLIALRVAGLPLDEPDRKRFVTAVFMATWAGGGGSESAADIERIADSIGLSGADLVARAGEPAAKERLRVETASALERGVFGVPTVDADGELFWGVDGIGFLAAYLEGVDPVPPDAAARWANLAATATRSRSRS
jgi:2-hydroxychromene-2-carboxylate isomerase